MKISVIIPVFNREKELPRALDSLINQQYTDWEAIVVDDGSKDASFAIAQSYQKKDERIKVFTLPHAGLVPTRNFAGEQVRGDWITFLDSDDCYEPDHLSYYSNLIERNPDVSLIKAGARVIGDDTVADKYDLTKQVRVKDIVITGMIFVKKEAYEAVGGFNDLPYGEDSDLFERIDKLFTSLSDTHPSYVYDRTTENSLADSFENYE